MTEGFSVNDRLLTRAEVERCVGLTKTSIYRMMRAGQFPEPLQVGQKAVRWPASEIEAWIASRPRARGKAEPHAPTAQETLAIAMLDSREKSHND